LQEVNILRTRYLFFVGHVVSIVYCTLLIVCICSCILFLFCLNKPVTQKDGGDVGGVF